MMTSVDVRDIFFSQSTISPTFKNGNPIEDLIASMKDGTTTVDDLETIRVVEVDGKLISLDNRRLFCMKSALKGKHSQNVTVKVVHMSDPHPNDKKCAKPNTLLSITALIQKLCVARQAP